MLTKRSIKADTAILLAMTLLLCGPISPLAADVLLIQNVQQAPPNNRDGLSRPSRGMDMVEVEQIFGPPLEKHPAVGKPPISRWDYGRYSVYFETDRVLHSVVRRPRNP